MMGVESLVETSLDGTTVTVATSPKFKNPPVVETVLGVQFPEPDGFRAVHFGLFWETLRKRYPKVEDQPRLDTVQELFPRPPVTLGPNVTTLQRMPVHRVWLTAKSGAELIQVQPDRFLFNWRRKGSDELYPSYKTNGKKFLDEFDGFCKFCRDQTGLAEPKPNVCEVTYVNHINPGTDETAGELAGRVFSGLRWDTTEGRLSPPESFAFNRAFVIEDGGRPIGRLYAEATIAVRPAGSKPREFVLFKLTARINRRPDDDSDLRESMQRAHDEVVFGFADLADKAIQYDRWERYE